MSQLISFSTLTVAIAIGVGAISTVFGDGAKAQSAPRVAEPVAHANLSIYLLRGTSSPGPVPLTLSEALAKGSITVHETGNVNQLEVENSGADDVFIQAGDIVKGGQQDRVLTVSLLLAKGTGRLPIGAFCVEQGRWSARGKEDVKRFTSSDKAVPSREAKLAMLAPAKPRNEPRPGNLAPAGETAANSQQRSQSIGRGGSDTGSRQGEVWASVGQIQEKLSSNLKAKVASGQSESSLQLSLENEALAAVKADYIKALQPAAQADGDVVGVVFAINGRISSAEIYPSNGLFRKMWPKLLDAGSTEAIGNKHEAATAAPTTAMVAAFLANADQGKSEAATVISAGLQRQATDGTSALKVATRRADGFEIHRTYLAK